MMLFFAASCSTEKMISTCTMFLLGDLPPRAFAQCFRYFFQNHWPNLAKL